MERDDSTGRRAFLAASTTVGIGALAGCTGLIGSDDTPVGQIGSGRAGRPEPGGTPVDDLPDLEGELVVYSGRGELLIGRLLAYLEDRYDDFEVSSNTNYSNSSELATQIQQEGTETSADVFYTVDSGALGALADEGRTLALSEDVTDLVENETFYTDDWVGTSGRARTIPYNTDALSAEEMPDSIDAYATDFDGTLGWAPGYGSCQGFITSMRILEGEEYTRTWLENLLESGVEYYGNEYAVAEAVEAGELDAGFTNHYYIQRVIEGTSDASIASNFTSGDAGATFDVAGAAVIDEADDPELAENFVAHLLSSEAQEYFAVETFEYPTIEGVDPVGDLPTLEELEVPTVDPTELSNLEETVDLMLEAGVDL